MVSQQNLQQHSPSYVEGFCRERRFASRATMGITCDMQSLGLKSVACDKQSLGLKSSRARHAESGVEE
jgi:hypothetical protein